MFYFEYENENKVVNIKIDELAAKYSKNTLADKVKSAHIHNYGKKW